MAQIRVRSRRRRFRRPGQLLAEVALALLLLTALVVYWPAGAPSETAADAGAIAPDAANQPTFDELPGRGLVAPGATAPTARPSPRPVQLLISTLNLHPKVESVGVNRYGAMAVPHNYFDVAWYNLGPIPGNPGDAVIDGHAGYPDQPLVFGRLASLKSGDKIVVVLSDDSRRTFIVNSLKSWPPRAHPTGLFQPDGAARLTLITCSGDFNDQTKTYDKRLVVEASFTALG